MVFVGTKLPLLSKVHNKDSYSSRSLLTERPIGIRKCLVSLIVHQSFVSECQRPYSNGGFCFFGDFLKWSSSPSQHAYAIFPEYRYNPRPADEEPTWTPATEWASLAGQQRELLYVNDGNICYGGTFLCHAGPHSIKVEDFGGDIDEVRLNVTSRSP